MALVGTPYIQHCYDQDRRASVVFNEKVCDYDCDNVIDSGDSKINDSYNINCATHSEHAPEEIIVLRDLLTNFNMQHAHGQGSSCASAGNPSDSEPIVIGGLQQLLNRISSRSKEGTLSPQPSKRCGCDQTTFHDLPDSLQLYIFSYLGAKELCRSSRVCQLWLTLTSDDILWKTMLERDMHKWTTMGHCTSPGKYLGPQSALSHKQTYLRCSPEINRLMRAEISDFYQLSKYLRYLFPRKTPKFAMFGPGLETKTSLIVRKIIQDKNDFFSVKGMFPGQFEGLGSGFNVSMKEKMSFCLTTLYGSTKREREKSASTERLQNHRLLVNVANDPDMEERQDYDLLPAVKNLCRSLDGFIFVIDVTQTRHSVCNSALELEAMIRETDLNKPVVILACVPDSTTVSQCSIIEVIDDLHLNEISRPWQVQFCNVDTIESVCPAIEWLIETSQHR